MNLDIDQLSEEELIADKHHRAMASSIGGCRGPLSRRLRERSPEHDGRDLGSLVS
jgi:hypothetical protein